MGMASCFFNRFRAMVLLLSLLSSSLASVRGSGAPVATICPPRATSLSSRQAQLQQVADSFEYVLETMSSTNENHIPVDPLLDACRALLRVLEQTGPKAVARDFENNIRKIESACHITNRRTVSSLLQIERDNGVHREGKDSSLHLNDQSGAMGLLWIRRTLAFQSDFYERLLEEDSDPVDAINYAYQQQLKPYHGWALSKCYNLMVGKKLPPRKSLLAMFGGYLHHEQHENDDLRFHYEEEKTLDDLKRLVASWRPLIQRWKRSFIELGMEDTRKV